MQLKAAFQSRHVPEELNTVAVDAETPTSSQLSSPPPPPTPTPSTRPSHPLYLPRSGCQSESGIISVMELLAFAAAAAASSSALQAARPQLRGG